MAAHSHLGPSAAKRWIHCPGSVALCAKAPREAPNVYAVEGQVAHSLAEDHLGVEMTKPQIQAALQGKLGLIVKKEGFDIEVTQEMIDGVLEYWDSVDEARRYFKVFPEPKQGTVVERIEVKVKAPSMDPDKNEVWGQCDYLAYMKGEKLFVFDFKYGRRPVDPVENEQACTYAIAVMDQEAGWDFEEVEIRIIQPRDMSGGNTTKSWVTTPAWLKNWRDMVAVPAVRATRKEGAELRPGAWCEDSFCAARAFCPALRRTAGEIAQSDFSVAPAKPLPDVLLLTTEEQEKALMWRDTVKGWFNALEAVLQGKAEHGESLTYWKLVEGRANRQWKDEEKVVEHFGEEAYAEPKILSPNQLETKLKLKAEDTKAFWHKPEGKKSLAPMSDKREAKSASVRDDFTPTCRMCEVGFCTKHPKTKGLCWPV